MDTFKLLQTLTETPGPSGNETKDIAVEAYVYAYPLVLMEMTRRMQHSYDTYREVEERNTRNLTPGHAPQNGHWKSDISDTVIGAAADPSVRLARVLGAAVCPASRSRPASTRIESPVKAPFQAHGSLSNDGMQAWPTATTPSADRACPSPAPG